MRAKPLFLMFGVICLVTLSLSSTFKVTHARTFSSIWFEPFSGPTVYDDFSSPLENRWRVYRGNPAIVQAAERPSVLRLSHPEPRGELGPFGSSVGTSLFLTNPATWDFADGMIEFDIYFETSGWSGVSAMLTFRMQSDDSYYALRLASTRDWSCSFMIYLKYGDWKEIGIPSEKSAFPTGAWSHVAVTIGGSRMSCYRDGVLICSANDNGWSQGFWGGIGLQNNYYGGTFYVDNFKIPGRMRLVQYRGAPRIDPSFGRTGSSLLFDHPSIYGDEASFGDPDSCSTFISDPDLRLFENGVIEFDMFFDNEGGQKAFVAFRIQDDHSYYAARLTSTYDWPSHFVKRTDINSWQAIGSKSYLGAITPKTWFHVTIIISGNHFEMWRDEELLSSADDSTIVRGKWAGIGFYSAYFGGVFHIDNLKICIQS